MITVMVITLEKTIQELMILMRKEANLQKQMTPSLKYLLRS